MRSFIKYILTHYCDSFVTAADNYVKVFMIRRSRF